MPCFLKLQFICCQKAKEKTLNFFSVYHYTSPQKLKFSINKLSCSLFNYFMIPNISLQKQIKL